MRGEERRRHGSRCEPDRSRRQGPRQCVHHLLLDPRRTRRRRGVFYRFALADKHAHESRALPQQRSTASLPPIMAKKGSPPRQNTRFCLPLAPSSARTAPPRVAWTTTTHPSVPTQSSRCSCKNLSSAKRRARARVLNHLSSSASTSPLMLLFSLCFRCRSGTRLLGWESSRRRRRR